MRKATFRFYEELNDFLPDQRRKKDFSVEIREGVNTGEMIRNLGVPMEAVDLILANGISVGFGYSIQDGDRLSVYPVFESIDIRNLTRVRDKTLRETRFIADADLVEIAGYMRSLGFDVFRNPTLPDQELVEISITEKRIILTKNRSILKQRKAPRIIHIKPGTMGEQVKRIMDQLDL